MRLSGFRSRYFVAVQLGNRCVSRIHKTKVYKVLLDAKRSSRYARYSSFSASIWVSSSSHNSPISLEIKRIDSLFVLRI